MATAETTSGSTTTTVISPHKNDITTAATTPSNHASKTMTTTASSTPAPKTPMRSNYAAPHTPIASAKRPRGSASAARSNGDHKNVSSQQAVMHTPIAEHKMVTVTEGLTTSAGNNHDSKVQYNGSCPQSLPTPMSPMHPPRPVTRSEEDTDPVDESADTVNNSGSWVGRKVDALFSPVLSFLNGGKEGEEATEYDENGDVIMVYIDNVDEENNVGYVEQQIEAAIAANSDKADNTAPAVEANDTSTTVSTSASSTPTNRCSVTLTVSSNEVDNEVSTGAAQVYPHPHNAAAVAQQYPSPSEDYKTTQEQQAVQEQHALRQQEEQYLEEEEDNEEEEYVEEDEDEEEEFNPYLFIKTLPTYSTIVPNPHHRICLPPKHPLSPPIALVLDLDETLVHCTVEPTPDADMVFPVVFNGIQYQVHVRTRPYLREFLEAVVDKFEVIVFTASQKVYADELLDRIDPEGKYIKHRMFREACLPVEGNYLKDLNVLGRDLRKAVLVDNSPHAFGYQVDNGIPIESWFDDPNDTELLKLEQFLRTLHGADDVRDMVRARFQTYRLVADA